MTHQDIFNRLYYSTKLKISPVKLEEKKKVSKIVVKSAKLIKKGTK
jgi:hypothetical protein